MIKLILGDSKDVEIPSNAAIISDPPYGCNNNCNYTRFSGGLSPSRNYHHGITGDDSAFDPSRWIKYKHVCLFGYQFFADRLPLGTILVWLKKRDNQLGTFLSDCELAWMKGGKGCYLHKHIWHGFDRETERGSKSVHPTQKPIELMRWIIGKMKLPPGTIIVDPYCGSGSTLLAAESLGFDSIGIEVDPAYHGVAESRINAN